MTRCGTPRATPWNGGRDSTERYIPDMTALMNGMNDAPRGDLDMEEERWDDERAAKSERSLAQAGMTGYQTLARHAATGEPAGYTRILARRSSRTAGPSRSTPSCCVRTAATGWAWR